MICPKGRFHRQLRPAESEADSARIRAVAAAAGVGTLNHSVMETRESSSCDQAILVHGEMGKFFPMPIARLPHAHLAKI